MQRSGRAKVESVAIEAAREQVCGSRAGLRRAAASSERLRRQYHPEKVSRPQKQRERLEAIEADLHKRLIAALELVAGGWNTDFFTTSEFNPFELRVPEESEALSNLALEALRLRVLLGDSSEESIGAVFRNALALANDRSNAHRLGAIRHAQELLATLRGETNVRADDEA
jgi:hypothetical protein